MGGKLPEGWKFVQPSTPPPGNDPAEVPANMVAPALDTPLGEFNTIMAEIRNRTASATFAAQRGDHAQAREWLAAISAAVRLAEQLSLTLEVPDIDLDAITVEAVRIAVAHRNRFTVQKFKMAPVNAIYRALAGDYRSDGSYAHDDERAPVDHRVAEDQTTKRLNALVERGVLTRSKGWNLYGIK